MSGLGFQEAINAVAPLLAGFDIDFGPIERIAYGHCVRGISEHVQLDITNEWQRVYMRIAPRNMGGQIDGDAMPLSMILLALAPDEQFVERDIRSAAAMSDEVERQVTLLIRYCRRMLEGDFTAWPLVAQLKYDLWPVEGEPLEEWAASMRQMLSDAIEARRYTMAYMVCSRLRMFDVGMARGERASCREIEREIRRLRRNSGRLSD